MVGIGTKNFQFSRRQSGTFFKKLAIYSKFWLRFTFENTNDELSEVLKALRCSSEPIGPEIKFIFE